MSKLNKKQKAFADYYIESLNATESYKMAYNCSYNTARTNGARLLTNANIKKYIHLLNRQQVKTLNGQIKAGNEEGALKGLVKILKRQGIIID